MSVPIQQYMTPLPHTIGVEQSLREAYQRMRRFQIRHLPVLSGGKLVGVVSIGDITAIDFWTDAPATDISVEEAMTPSPYAVAPATALAEVAETMAKHKYGCCLVQEGNKTIGVFTVVDACRALSERLTEPAQP